ncbi:MAG: hypothetical protein ABIQ86_09190 [Steroidobacteraceae bacterium]
MLPRIPLLLVAALLAGCASLPVPRGQHAPSPAPPSAEIVQAAQLANHVLALQIVVQGSPTEQAEAMASARAGYEQAKQGPTALHYGLLLAAPVHPARDASLAQRLLREALAHPELLSVGERALAVVELARVDAELRLVFEIDRLVADLQRERERQSVAPSNTALNKRLQAEQEESARLRKALEEARAKLDAITTIERNFSDRPTAPEGRTP